MENQQDHSPSTDFDRFKDFARRIVAVPKQEVDEAARKLAAQKPKPEKRASS